MHGSCQVYNEWSFQEGTCLRATCEGKLEGGPIDLGVMGLEPVCFKDDVVVSDGCDIEF